MQSAQNRNLETDGWKGLRKLIKVTNLARSRDLSAFHCHHKCNTSHDMQCSFQLNGHLLVATELNHFLWTN